MIIIGLLLKTNHEMILNLNKFSSKKNLNLLSKSKFELFLIHCIYYSYPLEFIKNKFNQIALLGYFSIIMNKNLIINEIFFLPFFIIFS